MRHWLRRYRWWLAVACLSCAIGIVAWYVQAARSIFTRAQYEQIRLGMTRADVEAVMGSPPVNRVNRLSNDHWEQVAFVEPPSLALWDGIATWCDNDTWITVYYAGDRTVGKRLWIQVPVWKRKARQWFPKICKRIGL
jgi:hypothetical protein